MHEIIRVLRNAGGRTEIESFLKAVLTQSELKEIETRLEIMTMLLQKFSQREIAKHLKVGLTTVSRGAEVIRQLEEKKPRWWKDFKSW